MLRLSHQGFRQEAPTMMSRTSMHLQRPEMSGGAVAFVAIKPIAGVGVMQCAHQSISGDLGDNRRSRDDRA